MEMELEHLMQALSLNQTATKLRRSCEFQTGINNIHTSVLYEEYDSYYIIKVEQTGGRPTSCKVSFMENFSGSAYHVQFIPCDDDRSLLRVATKIAANLNITKTLLLFLSLRDYGMETVLTLIEAIRNGINNISDV